MTIYTVTLPRSEVSDREAEEVFAALPLDQRMLIDALSQAMAALSAEHRAEYAQELAALREKVARLEGQLDIMTQGKGQIFDLPPLPRKLNVA